MLAQLLCRARTACVAALAGAMAFLLLVEFSLAAPTRQEIQHALATAHARMAQVAPSIPNNRYPIYANSAGAWVTTDASSWTSGFYPGAMWLAYEQSGDTAWATRATQRMAGVESQKFTTSHHDLGFMILNSFGQAFRLTGNTTYKDVVLTAAGSLATRYNANVGMIRSWGSISDTSNFTVIVDNLMNLELLMWASKQPGGQASWSSMANNHALRSLSDLVRSDGSTFHVANYNPNTGALTGQTTHQGYSANSTWARGQAWAMYGFTMMYRETGNPTYLDAARRTSDFFISNLPADSVPYWDFNAPGTNPVRDSSAAAIAASALVELSVLSGQSAYYDAAGVILASLIGPRYFGPLASTPPAGLLLHGTYHYNAGMGVDVPVIWGDYYLLEALGRYDAQIPEPSGAGVLLLLVSIIGRRRMV